MRSAILSFAVGSRRAVAVSTSTPARLGDVRDCADAGPLGKDVPTHGHPATARRVIAAALASAVLVGCATAPHTPDHELPGRGATASAVAVIASPLPLQTGLAFEYADQAQGFGAGAAKGGLAGALIGLQLLGQAGGALVYFPPAMLAVIMAPMLAGALIGGAATSAAIPSVDAAATSRSMADALGAQTQASAAIAQGVADGASRFAGRPAEVLDLPMSGADGDAIAYRLLHERGYGWAIEVRATKAGFAASSGTHHGIALFAVAQARFVDTATGKLQAERGLVYESAFHDLAVWARDEGAVTMRAVEQAWRTLAERIVDDLLLETPADMDGAWPPMPRTCGIAPERPQQGFAFALVPDGAPVTGRADSTTPWLEWQRVPATGRHSDPPWARASDIRYDVRIWDQRDGAPGDLVYERYGLPEAHHRVETALASGATFYWSVRMRYIVDGRARATRWSASNVQRAPLTTVLRNEIYRARIEGDTLVRRGCDPAHLVPCGCLDYIPVANHYSFRTP